MFLILVRMDRDLYKIGQSKSKEEARKIMEESFMKIFWQKFDTYAGMRDFREIYEEYKDDEVGLNLDDAWINGCNFSDFDWKIAEVDDNATHAVAYLCNRDITVESATSHLNAHEKMVEDFIKVFDKTFASEYKDDEEFEDVYHRMDLSNRCDIGERIAWIEHDDYYDDWFIIPVDKEEAEEEPDTDKSNWEKVTIYVTDADGLNVRNWRIELLASPNIDIRKAIEDACNEYCKTDDGKNVYEDNCNCFNWGDFDAYVPNNICEKYGFSKAVAPFTKVLNVNMDEQLVDESEIFLEE